LLWAKTLMTGGNLLMLDEPTNDLDVDTLRALEEAVLDFSGCAVVISRDRWFPDRVATHILAYDGDSEVVWLEGNYHASIEDLMKPKGPDADQPHRTNYKKLARKYFDRTAAMSDPTRRVEGRGLRGGVPRVRIGSVAMPRHHSIGSGRRLARPFWVDLSCSGCAPQLPDRARPTMRGVDASLCELRAYSLTEWVAQSS
jgi:hypothetical protein